MLLVHASPPFTLPTTHRSIRESIPSHRLGYPSPAALCRVMVVSSLELLRAARPSEHHVRRGGAGCTAFRRFARVFIPFRLSLIGSTHRRAIFIPTLSPPLPPLWDVGIPTAV